jgi:hypothetical protein
MLGISRSSADAAGLDRARRVVVAGNHDHGHAGQSRPQSRKLAERIGNRRIGRTVWKTSPATMTRSTRSSINRSSAA